MVSPMPGNANDFIEGQLDLRIEALEEAFDADVIGFSGGIIDGVDDIIRNVIEHVRANSEQEKLAVVLTTLGGYIEVHV